jgi:hypothetical protein
MPAALSWRAIFRGWGRCRLARSRVLLAGIELAETTSRVVPDEAVFAPESDHDENEDAAWTDVREARDRIRCRRADLNSQLPTRVCGWR